jgi:hypothetical protein
MRIKIQEYVAYPVVQTNASSRTFLITSFNTHKANAEPSQPSKFLNGFPYFCPATAPGHAVLVFSAHSNTSN